MRHRIIKRTSLGNRTSSIFTFNGFGEYFLHQGCVGFFMAIFALPFLLIYWFIKLIIISVKGLYHLIDNIINKGE